MKSLQIVPSLLAEGGGPSYTVPRLAEALNSSGWDAELAVLQAPAARTSGGIPVNTFGRDTTFIPMLSKLGRSRAMSEGLGDISCDVLHAHGLWMMPSVYSARVARRKGRPFVLSPRGMLGADALKFSASAKRLFWAMWQARAITQVNCFHATAESELEDIRAFGLKGPVAIVPNGVDLPNKTAISNNGDKPFVLSLGRLHPKKGLESLIEAFSLVAADFPSWKLRIVGIDEDNYSEVLRRSIASFDLEGRAQIEPPIFGERKYALMANASLFALPSLHENFAVTVAESLAVGTPVVSSKGAPWKHLETNGCGWWIDHGAEALAGSLRQAMSLPQSARDDMGKRGRDWMSREFSWDGIGNRMAQVYEWLLKRGPKPSFVEL